MKTALGYLYYVILRFVLSLRYRVKVKGRESLTSETLSKPHGTLFLATHPAEIDPCILLRIFWPKFRLRPVAIEYLFRKPIVRYLLDFVGALPIPNFEGSSNSFKKKQIDETYARIFEALRQGDNLLIYPAGGLKNSGEEVIGGASGIQYILEQDPNVNVVLISTRGLWGSSFSRALTGKSPDLISTFLNGLKVLLCNGIFFTPRREVIVECAPAPEDFPWKGGRLEINRYLEGWYNAPGPEPLTLVSYSCFRKVYPKIYEKPKEEEVSDAQVPEETKQRVLAEIATLAKVTPEELTPDLNLATDLGLDSLDIAQLVVLLKEDFGVTSVHSSDLTTVRSVFVFAARLKKGKEEEEEETRVTTLWEKEKTRPFAEYGKGATLPEVFFNTCKRMDGYLACVDLVSGEVPYKRLQVGVLLLADHIRRMPGERIGILMPASVVVNAVILATLLAGKTPVMINWTLGERNLGHVLSQSGTEVTISSWSFLDRLDNVELGPLNDQVVLLEELRRSFTLWDKLKASLRARRKTHSILKLFKVDQRSTDDPAVVLFTSGTESVPKGVVLSHKNLITNQKGAYEMVDIPPTEVMLGVLPPFHSFGFSVTGLLPLLAGMRVAYSPNPTDGRRIAKAIERWQVTLLCLAPTFLKNVLRVATPAQMKSVRLVVAGAERTDPQLYEKLDQLNPSAKLIEGYGITECAPILTLNPPGERTQGVGMPFPDVELKIVDPETHTPLPQGEQGLILARGPNIFAGYLDPKLPSPFVNMNGSLWYLTGDLGYLDERGYLTLSGRLKRFVKIGGEMVSLTSIEEALVQQAEIQGWKLDPELPSFAVCALEEEGKKTEMHLFTSLPLTSEEVNRILRECGMSNLIRIRSVKQLPYIPVLGTGKIDYRKLTQTYLQG